MDAYLLSLSKDDFERMKIVSALKGMMVNEPFESVTVTALCKEAHVSRSVFYRLFADLTNVVFWELQRLMQRASIEVSSEDGWRKATTVGISNYFSYLLEEADFFQRIHREMSHDDSSAVYHSTRRYFRDRQLAIIREVSGHEPDNRCVFEINFFICGVSNAVAAWAAGGMKEAPDVIAERIIGCMPTYLASMFDSYDAASAL